ncbi:MAG: type II toxin-antitoxin system ParD family antitoxin [Burkholderiaceae bacterium]
MPSSYAIGEHFEQFIRQQVDGGRYASASEVVRDALRMLEQEEERRAAALRALRDEVRKGVASGRGKPADEVLERLERKYAAQAQLRRSSSK